MVARAPGQLAPFVTGRYLIDLLVGDAPPLPAVVAARKILDRARSRNAGWRPPRTLRHVAIGTQTRELESGHGAHI